MICSSANWRTISLMACCSSVRSVRVVVVAMSQLWHKGAKLGALGALERVGQNSRQTRQTSTAAAIARLADRQHGNVKRAQLLCLGLNDDAIAHRPWLHRGFHGFYAVC